MRSPNFKEWLVMSIMVMINTIIIYIFQTTEGYFNKGSLFNAGFVEIERRFPAMFDCIVLQDVDVLPEDNRISYACKDTAWHLASHVDAWGYT